MNVPKAIHRCTTYKVILFPDYVMLWLLLEMLVESVQLRSADFPPKIDLFNLISQKQKSQNTVMRFVLYSSRLLFCSNFTPCFIMETRYVAFWTNIGKQFDSYLLTVKVNTCSDIWHGTKIPKLFLSKEKKVFNGFDDWK